MLKRLEQKWNSKALGNGLVDNLDTFKDIDPIEAADEVSNNLSVISKMYISQKNLDDDDWEDDDVFIEDDEGDEWTRYTLTVFMFAMSQFFLLQDILKTKSRNHFFVDYFICNFDKNIWSSCFNSCVCFDEKIFLFPWKKMSIFTSICKNLSARKIWVWVIREKMSTQNHKNFHLRKHV